MEFDELKNIWKKSFDGEEGRKLTDEEIQNRLKLKNRTESVIGKIKRSYMFEILTFIVFMPIMYNFIFKIPASNIRTILFVFLTVFFGLLFYYLLRKYTDVRKVALLDDQIILTLKKGIKSIDRYINFNKSGFAKLIIFPLGVLAGLVLGLMVGSESGDIQTILELPRNTLIFLIIFLVVIYGVYLLVANRTYQALYGKHLNELKKCLQELEESELSEE